MDDIFCPARCSLAASVMSPVRFQLGCVVSPHWCTTAKLKVLQLPQGLTPAQGPQCSEIIYIQTNPLFIHDEDVTVRAGKDFGRFHSASFVEIKMASRFTLDFSGGDPHCDDEAETYYSFFLHILCSTSVGQLLLLHNVCEKVEIQMSGRRVEYILVDEGTWSNLKEKHFKG